ncbi:MAG: ABC transporter substrate-binding protein [Betaproteobacteria bacterium]|nr:MAG: ABC transporter substrate-binding protein [Betaproteobacteria bacterium]
MNLRAIAAVAFGVSILLAPAIAQQPTKAPRIGYLTISPRETQTHLIEAFERGLTERGYSVGRDILIEYRFADGNPERLQGLADDLVRAKVNVLVTGVNPNIRAAQRATKSIPIVAAISYFPVEEGLVQSLARPSGNVTGLTSDVAEEVGKRLQLLRQAAPRISRVAALYGVGEGYAALVLAKLEIAARRLGVTIIPIELRGPEDVERAWAEIERNNADALIGFGAASLFTRVSILRLAAKAKLPTIFSDKQYVDDGALMSYGVDLADNFRKAAGYVDRILKGAKPADLPFEQPTRYVLAINLKTAKALGITIPQTLLLQADHLVEQ